jgi:hypothetical protein
MKHSKRDKLTPSDINNALKLRNVEVWQEHGPSEICIRAQAPFQAFNVTLLTVHSESKLTPMDLSI